MKALIGIVGIAAIAGVWGPALSQTLSAASPPAAPAALATEIPTPAATAAVSVLQNVCLPLINGADLKKVAPSEGFKLKDGQWILPIAGKRQIEIEPPDSINPHVCSAVVVHRIGGQPDILQAVSQWAADQTPPLMPVKVQEPSVGLTYQRTTSTWARQTPKGGEGLVLAAEKTLQGKPVAGDADQSELMISVSPA